MSKRIPLIFLPGTLCDARLWQYQMESLEGIADITVGNISRKDSIKALAMDVLSEAPQEFALAGLSLGGIVALEIMRIAPERVTKLALLDTNPYPPKIEQRRIWDRYFEMITNNQFMDITKKHLLPVLIHPDQQNDKELVSVILRMAETVGEEAYINQLKAVMNRNDQTSILPTISCPTTIIVGKEDQICPVHMSVYMATTIPGSNIKIIENAGHLITLEQPEIVNKYLREWLLT
ncbi:alpha/beta fold hydrolase [Sporosarcina sp. 6E9]|uniref:alpha/beta fold hydrolase n=1 Tax=Sporosarcina sp. 6E9 TaxID=2819235 RepID=UPI001ACB7B3B|nr:alpha/beta hydrolase [Sporosarcina sp. 6E9]MBO1909822.1 alpha/beta hydrolase [Microvirga sp. 3-52]